MGSNSGIGRRPTTLCTGKLARLPTSRWRATRRGRPDQADAAVNRMFIAACDRTGREVGTDWVGGSVIVDADGWPLAGGTPTSAPTTIMAECRLADALDKAIGGTATSTPTADPAVRPPNQTPPVLPPVVPG